MIKNVVFGEKGMALAIVLVMSVVLMSFCLVFLFISRMEVQDTQHDEAFIKGLPLSETGTERAIWVLLHDDKIPYWDAPGTTTPTRMLYGCNDPWCPYKDNPSSSLNATHTTCKSAYSVQVEFCTGEFSAVPVIEAKFEMIEVTNRLAQSWAWTGSGGDFDEDGDDDFVVGGQVGQMEFLPNETHDGNFTTFRTIQGAWTDPHDIKGMSPAFDFNGDAKLDVVTYEMRLNKSEFDRGRRVYTRTVDYRLWTGNGDGTFNKMATFATTTNNDSSDFWNRVVSAGNIDGDGDIDIVVPDIDGRFRIYKNNGNGNFTLYSTLEGWTTTQWANTAGLGDFDKDGDLDLIGGSVNDDMNYKLWRNNGNGDFTPNGTIVMPNYGNVSTPAEAYSDASGADCMLVKDFDGDGDIDIIVGTDNWRADTGDRREKDHRGNGGKVYYFENEGDNFNFAPVYTFQNQVGNFWSTSSDGNWVAKEKRGDTWWYKYENPYRFSIDFDSGGVADVDGDGYPDFMIGDTNNSGVIYFFKNMSAPGSGESQGETLKGLYRLTCISEPQFRGLVTASRKTECLVEIKNNIGLCGSIGSLENIDYNGAPCTDSYNSSVGRHTEGTNPNGQPNPNRISNNNGNEGHIISNNNINLSGNVLIDGDATCGPGKNITVGGSAIITGARKVATKDMKLSSIQVPQGIENKGNITDNMTLTTGTYSCSGINLQNNRSLTINGKVILYCTGNVQIWGNVNTQNNNAKATNFHLLCTSGTAEIRLKPQGFYGTIYAPESNIEFQGNARIYGQLVGRRVSGGGSGNVWVIYDEQLKYMKLPYAAEIGGTAKIIYWREQKI
ncbi:MAG: FG-GAP and VCBS repeat-containing protein [bacterium]|nr:FG-GAP and VCBS repeat-containing protein [bacterium]